MPGRWPTRLPTSPRPACNCVRIGAVEQWLRRELGDADTRRAPRRASASSESGQLPDDAEGDAVLVMRAIALLDPLAPLCWRGSLWPDGVGPALAAARRPGSIVDAESWPRGGRHLGPRCDPIDVTSQCCASKRASTVAGFNSAVRAAMAATDVSAQSADALRQPAGGRSWVAPLADLLPALEAAATTIDREQTEPVDRISWRSSRLAWNRRVDHRAKRS